MKLMLRTADIHVAGGSALPIRVLMPATQADVEIFEKFRANTWYKSDCRKSRNPEFHDKGMALVRLIYNNQEFYRTFDDLLVELKIKAGWYVEHVRSAPPSPLLASFKNFAEQCPGWIRLKLLKYHAAFTRLESVVYQPKSISFAEMDDLEFETFYNAVIDIAIEDYKLEEALEFIGARKLERQEMQGNADT